VLDLIATRAGCDLRNSSKSSSLWKDLVERLYRCKDADKQISRDFTLIDLFSAAKADYVLRIGLSIYGQMMCELNDTKYKNFCRNILRSQDGFRNKSFVNAMKTDCGNQLSSYFTLLNASYLTEEVLRKNMDWRSKSS